MEKYICNERKYRYNNNKVYVKILGSQSDLTLGILGIKLGNWVVTLYSGLSLGHKVKEIPLFVGFLSTLNI